MAIKICLDAGHYGKYNQSPVVKEYYESDMNWKLHLKLKAELEERGFEVITTRADKNKDMNLYERGKASKGCDLFISIHSNAGAVDESVDYPLVIVPLDGRGDVLGTELAKCIQKTMGTKQNGRTWERATESGVDWYGVIRGAALVGVPGLILEHSFHTNTNATKWLMNDSNLDKLAREEATIIAKYYETKKTENTEVVKLPILRKGNKGASVKALQILLIGYGYSCGSTGADASFGGKTESAVKTYQTKNKLVVDGIVGKNTWNKLLGVT